MSRTWTLTDLEFVVAWEGTGEVILPEPLFYISGTRSLADAEHEKRMTAERLRARGTGLPETILACIARPDLRITVVGADPRDPRNPRRHLRMLGVRRGPAGYLVTQLPGESLHRSGGYRIIEGEATALAGMVVDALPAVVPGKYGEIPLPAAGFEFGSAVRVRGERFLRLPTALEGAIGVVQGSSRYGPRGVVRRALRWRDVLGDGRYVITGDSPATAAPVDAKRLTAALNNAVAHIVASIRDERR
ncbi:ESX secretion-associated protein EspG [Nocardia sp. X0981]